MNFAAQVEHEDDLTCLRFDIGNNFIDQRPYDALLQPRIGGRISQTTIPKLALRK